MKFNEDILKELNLEPVVEKEPVNVMQIGEMLRFFNFKCCFLVHTYKKQHFFSALDDQTG